MAIISALPITLTNGQIADASQVMQDFNQIVNNVNTNAAENGTNSSITSLTGLTTALSVAQGGTGAKTQANAFINIVAAGGTFTGDANLNANCNLNGTTRIAGNLTTTGTITANGNVTVNNNVSITGTVVVTGNETITGTTIVGGALNANGNVNFSNGTTFTLTGVTVTGAGVITQTNIASGAVGQAQLKTTLGTTTIPSGGSNGVVLAPGGRYGFLPTVEAQNNGAVFFTYSISSYQYDSAAPPSTTAIYINAAFAERTTIGWSYNTGLGVNAFIRQQYVTASPPYDLGDGEIPLFIFALIDKTNGNPKAIWTAFDPPWAFNGPTNIRPDRIDEDGRKWKRKYSNTRSIIDMINEGKASPHELESAIIADRVEEWVEIDQSMKQADMSIFPHPFLSADANNEEVVIIDPVGNLTHLLAELHDSGEEIGPLIMNHVVIGNDNCGCKSPPGVKPVKIKWK